MPESWGGCRLVSSGDRTHIFQRTFKRDVACATPKKNQAIKNHRARRLLVKIETNIGREYQPRKEHVREEEMLGAHATLFRVSDTTICSETSGSAPDDVGFETLHRRPWRCFFNFPKEWVFKMSFNFKVDGTLKSRIFRLRMIKKVQKIKIKS